MELNIIKSPKLVIALDIGSEYSGYAWQYKDEFEARQDVHFNTIWKAGAVQLHKTKTCIMIQMKDQDGGGKKSESHLKLDPSEIDKVKIGHDAENTYMKIAKQPGHKLMGKYYLFSKFKMMLYNEAGIGKQNVLLALEPEAATISCMHLPSQQKEDMNNFGNIGSKFLVADLGGSTADLSAVQVGKDGKLVQLCQPRGNIAGGQNINEAFLQHCYDSFQGDKWKDLFTDVTPAEAIKMEADFEKSKVQIGSNDEDDQMIELDLPRSIRKGLEDKSIILKHGSKVHYNDPEFLFEPRFVKDELFQTTCNMIYHNMKVVLQLKETKGISTVILVGGFAESPIVIKTIREKVDNDFPGVNVVVPDSPFKSVLLGAVLYGHNPMIFSSRISRGTYGVGTNKTFDDAKHDASKKWYNVETQVFECKHIFDIHVKKGQPVSLLKSQPKRVYYPLYKEQKSVTLYIFVSPEINPTYTTDDGCKQIGTITVDMPETTGGTGRIVEVSMIYGGTHIDVIAKDRTTGKEFDAEIDFQNL